MNQPEIVNPVESSHAEAWLRVLRRGLLADPNDKLEQRAERMRRYWPAERTWGARDGKTWVATLRTEDHTLSVPGPGPATRELAMDGLTCVSVAATHRRRGLLSAMLDAALREAKDRGAAVSGLIAAEWPIYGRFGYAPATVSARYRYHPRRRQAAPSVGDPHCVQHVEPDELGEVAPAVFDAARRLRPGHIDRRAPWWSRRLGLEGNEPIDQTSPSWLIHTGPAGIIDGLLAWRSTRHFDLDGTLGALKIEEFVTASDAAYRDLWAYLAGIDLIGEIELEDRPVDEPIRWLLGDGRALQLISADDFLWLRLLDVPKALGARSYAVPGQLVLDVVDDDMGGYGRGRVVLESAEDGTATCTATSATPDLRLSQRALASSYLGGHRLRARMLAGDVEELRQGALTLADTMFATSLPPWNQTGF